MAETITVAVTFGVDDEIRREILAVDPRVRLADFPAVALRPGAQLEEGQRAQAIAAIGEADVIFGPHSLPPELLAAATKLQWFQVITAGVDGMARQGLLNRGFVVTKLSGAAAPAIAEWVMGTMIMLCKGLHISARDQVEHKWNFRFTAELKGQTCGIVGMGAIGREVARRARAFGMPVIASRRRVNAGDSDPDCDALFAHSQLRDLLAQSDYVVLCIPLTDETRHVIGRDELKAMKPTASLINIARGAVVDQDALIEALRDGTISSAALDVFDPEPLPASSPFWEMSNVIMTPHISGAVEGYGHRAAAVFIANLRRFAAGLPLENVVDPVLAY
ncbi:MAG: D-2-hydroxyacid dehydrogenase [Dehalococcoidia bacterium]